MRNYFVGLFIIALGVTSCSEAFRKKMDKANSFLDEMMAKNVVVGTATETSGGQTMVMTTLQFEGANNDLEKAERERRANDVAFQFYSSMSKEDLKDETHLKIRSTTEDNRVYEYLFDLNDLAGIVSYERVAKEMLQAFIDRDSVKMQELKDDAYMTDEEMGSMYDSSTYMDTLYDGTQPTLEELGFRLTDGANDKSLKLYSANYEYANDDHVTYFIINVNRDTKKVVYLWVKTDPR